MYYDNYNLWDRTPICTKLVIYGHTPKDYAAAWRIWRYVNKIHMTAGQPASQPAEKPDGPFWDTDILTFWYLESLDTCFSLRDFTSTSSSSCAHSELFTTKDGRHELATFAADHFHGSHYTCLTNAINKSRILLVFDYQSYLNTVEHTNSSLSSSSSTPHPPGPPLHSQPFKFSSLLASSLKFWSFSTSPNHFRVDHLQPPFNHFPTAHALACEAHLVQFARPAMRSWHVLSHSCVSPWLNSLQVYGFLVFSCGCCHYYFSSDHFIFFLILRSASHAQHWQPAHF